jgi:hypothetical protein
MNDLRNQYYNKWMSSTNTNDRADLDSEYKDEFAKISVDYYNNIRNLV